MAVSLDEVRFLIVDDNVHMLNIVKTILRGFGAMRVVEVRNTQDAFKRLRHEPVDIIILDYLMENEDGVDFLRSLRAELTGPAAFTPVIMLTAHSDLSKVAAARDAGVTEFCVKPITAAELIRKVAAVVDRPRPFVRTTTYNGPDRRRRDDPAFDGEERRSDRLNAANQRGQA